MSKSETLAVHFSSSDLASQLTLIDLQVFKKIEPHELESCAWNKKNKNQVAPNIVAFTRRFNHVSFWVVEEVLRPDNARERIDMICHFIHVAKRLHDLNNLHSEYAILSALQSAPLFRLQKTWGLIPRKEKQTFDKLLDLFSEKNNFQLIRSHLDTLALSNCECIPYLGLYLTDLIHIDMAHPHSGGLEPPQRKTKMNNILRLLSELQQSSYSFIVDEPTCQNYLRSLKYIDELQKFVEDNQWKRSLEIEHDAKSKAATLGDESKIDPGVMQQLNLSPVKNPNTREGSHQEFVKKHRRAKSDGCGIFFSTNDRHRTEYNRNNVTLSELKHETASCDRHLLDDSKIDQEAASSKSSSAPAKKRTESNASKEVTIMEILRTPGIQCTYEGYVKRKVLIKDGKSPFVSVWLKFWMQLWKDSLVLYSYRMFHHGTNRHDFRRNPCKYFCINGWDVLYDKSSLSRDLSFQLTDPVRGNVYGFKTEVAEETTIWLHYLHQAVDIDRLEKYSKNLISFE